jgi:hypothetical protein
MEGSAERSSCDLLEYEDDSDLAKHLLGSSDVWSTACLSPAAVSG